MSRGEYKIIQLAHLKLINSETLNTFEKMLGFARLESEIEAAKTNATFFFSNIPMNTDNRYTCESKK